MDNFKLDLECGHLEKDEVKQFKRDYKNRFNVKFDYYDRSDWDNYSWWCISGKREDVKRWVLEEYLPNMEIDINDLDEEYDDDILDLIRN